MDEKKYVKVGGELQNITGDGTIAAADKIKDYDRNKSQSQINTEVYGHVSNIDAALQELSPDQTEALALATDVVNLKEDVNQGAVFDVSAKYPTYGVDGGNTYTLELALSVLNTYLPSNKKVGGMVIKFVDSSDNKYIQARCMAQNFTTDVTQWQGVDAEPTPGSNNLVESGGVWPLKMEKMGIQDFYGKEEVSWPATGSSTYTPLELSKDKTYLLEFSFSGFSNGDSDKFVHIDLAKAASTVILITDNPFVYKYYIVKPSDNVVRCGIYFNSQFVGSESKEVTLNVSEITDFDAIKRYIDNNNQEQNQAIEALSDDVEENTNSIEELGFEVNGKSIPFKALQDGVTVDQTFDVPSNSFLLNVKQVVGSTTKYLIQKIDSEGVASTYDSDLLFDTDYKISINKSTYPKMRIYGSQGTPTYEQDETSFLLTTNPINGNINDKIDMIEEDSYKESFTRKSTTIQTTAGSAISYNTANIQTTISKGKLIKLDIGSSSAVNVQVFYKLKGASTYTSSGLSSSLTPEHPIYTILEQDIDAIGFYRGGGSITTSETVIFSVFVYGGENTKNPLAGKKILMFGDSITQLPNTGSTRGLGIPEFFELFGGAAVYRAAIGGTKLSRNVETLPEEVTSGADATACYQICSLIQGMMTGDMTRQAYAIQNYISDTFTKDVTLPLMQSLNLYDIDAITIFGGTNDCSSGIELGQDSDMSPTTIKGAVNFIVKTIGENYPHIKVFFFTPIIRQFIENDNSTFSDDYSPNQANLKLPDYAESIMQASKKNHIPVCDLYWGLGWSKYNFKTFFASNDLTHPRFGFDIIAEKMIGFMKSVW